MAEKPTVGSDSDSNDEPVVGNVSKFCVAPPGQAGKPKRGQLIFDACFECGNLGRVDYITEYEYDLFIRPDTCNPRFRVWFNFTVENVRSDQRVIFNIVNFSKTKSLYRDGMTPLVKSTSRPKWVRIPPKHVYYYRCPDHRRNYVMSFAFCFDKETDVYQFAYCFPYSYTRLQNYLDNLEKKKLPYFRRELLCHSVQQRKLDLLTITNPENLISKEKQKVVFITSRVHPGETPASFVCQGLLDFLLSSHPIAKVLRDYLIFKIVPMLNPDGVYLGNYRSSLMGFDLNRHWQDPSPWAHPTVYATKNLVLEMDRDQSLDIDFYIDIHAHSTLMNGFMYGNIYDDITRYERQAIFPKLLCQNAEDFSLVNTNFNRDAVKAGTGRRTLGGCLDDRSLCYTLEVSFFSFMTSATNQALPYTEEGSQLPVVFDGMRVRCSLFVTPVMRFESEEDMKLGRNLARTFLDYYKLLGYIDVTPSSSLEPKVGKHSARSDKSGASSSSRGDSSRSDTYDTQHRVLSEPLAVNRNAAAAGARTSSMSNGQLADDSYEPVLQSYAGAERSSAYMQAALAYRQESDGKRF